MDNYGHMSQNEAMQSGQKGNKTGLGIASLVLGIVSLLLFCTCVNWITGILAIIFGIIQIVKNQERGFAIGGILTAGISLILWGILYIALFLGLRSAGFDYDDLYQYYYDGYDYYDDYYDYFDDDYYDYFDDDYYDYFDDDSYYYDGGEEFLSIKR